MNREAGCPGHVVFISKGQTGDFKLPFRKIKNSSLNRSKGLSRPFWYKEETDILLMTYKTKPIDIIDKLEHYICEITS